MRSRWVAATVPSLMAIAAAGVCAAQEGAPGVGRTTSGAAAIQRYCSGCHNAKTRAGGLALDAVIRDSVERHPQIWEKVVRKLRAGYMPPAGAPRPDESTYRSLLASLEASLDREAERNPNPGRTDTFRRLTRVEYQNAVRDLLALEVDVAPLLPADESSHGFDNITVADLSPTLLERYLNAARKIARLAVGAPMRAPGGETIQLPPDLTQEEHFEELPLGTRGGMSARYTFPLDARYDFQIRLQRDRNEQIEGLYGEHQVELMLDGEPVKSFTVRRPPGNQDHSKADLHLNARLEVKAGPHTVAVAFPRQASALLETERQPYEAHFNMDRHPRLTPAVYSLTINGPYEAQGAGETPSRRRIFTCAPGKEEEDCARRILRTLARRAWRRAVVDADLEALLRFYQQGRREGGFESGIEMGLRAILVSPEFLFRIERDPPGVAAKTVYRVSQVELASRLSFFLWSSIPDDELLDAAERGALASREALDRQARRMLADPRARALTQNFAGQWLQLRNLASLTPDMRLFADFDENLRQAMRRETELFFDSVLRGNRSALELIRADYSFLNERLAKHYGIPHVYGSRFRRVEFGEGSHRGGLLRQASVLAVTSYATRTSPVIRGKWILDNLLGMPPPPPPPAVPALKENGGVGKAVSMRERLARHRDNPACSGCHSLMDPVGFAFENYDAIGRWREFEEEGIAIDAAGGLPDGSSFHGVTGLQQALLERPELFVAALSEKLMTYALGRGVEAGDAPAIRKIVRAAAAEDYRLSTLVLGVVHSAPFQMRRSP